MQIDRLPVSIPTDQLEQIGQNQVEEQEAKGLANVAPAPVKVDAAEPKSEKKWTVPEWQKGFELDKALDMATLQAAQFMQKRLGEGELELGLEETEDGVQGTVRNMQNGEVKYTYNTRQMLTFMAQQMQKKGVVVDGAV
jgi:hypothetical protein